MYEEKSVQRMHKTYLVLALADTDTSTSEDRMKWTCSMGGYGAPFPMIFSHGVTSRSPGQRHYWRVGHPSVNMQNRVYVFEETAPSYVNCIL